MTAALFSWTRSRVRCCGCLAPGFARPPWRYNSTNAGHAQRSQAVSRDAHGALALLLQQQHGVADVFLAVVEGGLLAILTPTTFADVLSHRPLVDLLPTLDPVCSAGVGKTLVFALARVVRIVGRQDIAGRKIGGVQIENVCRELPPERHEAGQIGPCAVGDKERVIANIEGRRLCPQLPSP